MEQKIGSRVKSHNGHRGGWKTLKLHWQTCLIKTRETPKTFHGLLFSDTLTWTPMLGPGGVRDKPDTDDTPARSSSIRTWTLIFSLDLTIAISVVVSAEWSWSQATMKRLKQTREKNERAVADVFPTTSDVCKIILDSASSWAPR